MKSRIQNPAQILMSKRANIFYLEHVRVMQKDMRIVYLTETGSLNELFFNIPHRNTSFLLLGKGSSITDSAARLLAESNVLVGFSGSGGTPLFSLADFVFLTPVSEYGPTEYMQNWVKFWFDDNLRINAAKLLMTIRLEKAEKAWISNPFLKSKGITIPDSAILRLKSDINRISNSTELLSAEALWAKSLYATLASKLSISFTRREGGDDESEDMTAVIANSYLDHGNYLAYGLAAVALQTLGISYAFPLLHGKTRRGALVFDIADLIKDAYVMPLAFQCAKQGISDSEFRSSLILIFHETAALDFIFEAIVKIIDNQSK